ncbi:MAG: DnaJ domain-containing protein [Polyangiaceae bacterium]|nr:DnaJ domain-containing protein [Polyangiaceae bacterium]
MQLPGRLEVTTLGDVLGALYRERATGVLELLERGTSHPGRPHRLFIERGLVRDVDSALSVTKLGELLWKEGFLDTGTWHKLGRELLFKPTARVGELLTERRWASPDVVRAALRHQLRRRLDAVFRLEQADVRFHVAQPRRDAESPPLSPEEFLHGRPRARSQRASPPQNPQGNASGPGAQRPRTNPKASHAGPRRQNQANQTGVKQRKDPVRQQALATLGLGEGADRAAVQRAFRKLAREVHPDRHPGADADKREQLLRSFVKLSAAYHALVG